MRSWRGQRMCSSGSRNGGRVLRSSGNDIASNDADGCRDGDTNCSRHPSGHANGSRELGDEARMIHRHRQHRIRPARGKVLESSVSEKPIADAAQLRPPQWPRLVPIGAPGAARESPTAQ